MARNKVPHEDDEGEGQGKRLASERADVAHPAGEGGRILLLLVVYPHEHANKFARNLTMMFVKSL